MTQSATTVPMLPCSRAACRLQAKSPTMSHDMLLVTLVQAARAVAERLGRAQPPAHARQPPLQQLAAERPSPTQPHAPLGGDFARVALPQHPETGETRAWAQAVDGKAVLGMRQQDGHMPGYAQKGGMAAAIKAEDEEGGCHVKAEDRDVKSVELKATGKCRGIGVRASPAAWQTWRGPCFSPSLIHSLLMYSIDAGNMPPNAVHPDLQQQAVTHVRVH